MTSMPTPRPDVLADALDGLVFLGCGGLLLLLMLAGAVHETLAPPGGGSLDVAPDLPPRLEKVDRSE